MEQVQKKSYSKTQKFLIYSAVVLICIIASVVAFKFGVYIGKIL